ncbi:MAG: putative quinol monooxygenase [Rhizonema sp. PD38]|nr:putative quinol monooxygenase [Rhizonema sp. PD38]
MLLIIGTIRLPPNRLSDAISAMEVMITTSRAEPGCIEYSYAEDVLVHGLIHIKEAWTSQAALDDHFASAHIAVWRSTWQSLGITDRNLVLYEVGDPKPS